MAGFNELVGLAGRIKNKELREKVLDVISHPKLSHAGIKAKPCDLKKAPASLQYHHVYLEGLVQHTVAVTEVCIAVAEVLQKVYNTKLDTDSLVAASLVHDIGKLWGMKGEGASWEPTDLTLDHLILGVSELYSRGFPEKVLHIVASHFGENGPTPPLTAEAIIFNKIDNLDATLGANNQDNLMKMLLG